MRLYIYDRPSSTCEKILGFCERERINMRAVLAFTGWVGFFFLVCIEK